MDPRLAGTLIVLAVVVFVLAILGIYTLLAWLVV